MFIDFDAAFICACIGGGSYGLNYIIKNSIKRPRPNPKSHKVNVKGYSFASGHAVSSLAFYFSIVKYFGIHGLVACILMTLPFLLGLSRLYLKVHYPSDVIGGWLISYCYIYFCSNFMISLGYDVLDLLMKYIHF